MHSKIGVQPTLGAEGDPGASDYTEFKIAVKSSGCMAAGSVQFYSVGNTAEQF